MGVPVLGERFVNVLHRSNWLLVQRRWQQVGTPSSVMVVLDSTVVVRYGTKQAGAEIGYTPKKQGAAEPSSPGRFQWASPPPAK